MSLGFPEGDAALLRRLISSSSSDSDPVDLIFSCDADGFLIETLEQGEALEGALSGSLVAPNLLDLVDKDQWDAVRNALAQATRSEGPSDWVELKIVCNSGQLRWRALRLVRSRSNAEGLTLLGILRDVHRRRQLEEQLFVARMTDPLTQLTNRRAFEAMLHHVVGQRMPGCLGLIGIDHFRAINHRLGHTFGDEILRGFAQVLRTVMRTGDTLSRVGDAQFAVLFLKTGHETASALAQQAQEVFAGELPTGKTTLPLTATTGIAELGSNACDTLRLAEMAMRLGQAKGTGRVEINPPRRLQSAIRPRQTRLSATHPEPGAAPLPRVRYSHQ